MNNHQSNQIIGVGIYTPQEAALYGRLSVSKLSRWLFGRNNCAPVIDAQLKDELLVSFYDLVQAMAINQARKAGVTLPKIRQAITLAKDKYKVNFPLAHNHHLVLFDNDLHICFPNDAVIQVSGHGRNQALMKPIIEPFMKDLHFDQDGLVVRFTPFKKFGREITLDPKRQFGQPLVNNTGYRADVLAQSYWVERSMDFVASLYNIEIKDVKVAVDYMKSLRKVA